MSFARFISLRRVVVVIVVVFLGVLGWYLFVRTDNSSLELLVVHPQTFSQVIAVSGNVIAAQNSDLGFAQAGRVSAVYASVGDSVHAGQLIAEVENGDLRAGLAQKQAALLSAQADLSSLEVGTRPEELAVTEAQVESDQTALEQSSEAIVNAIQSAYTQSDDAVHNKIDEFITNPKSVSPQLTFSTSDSQLESTLLSDRSSIESVLDAWQGEVAMLDASQDLTEAQMDAQNNLALVAAILADANAALNAAITNQSTSQATIAGYVTTIATARANVNAAIATLTTAIASYNNTAALLDKDQKNLALEQAGSTPQTIDGAQAQVAAAQADVESAQAQLAKTQIVAPFTGTVSRMDAKVGEIVSPNTSEISLQSNGVFEIESYIPEVDIAAVSVGDMASTTLDAYGPNVFFATKVISIDPAQTIEGGVSTYKTTLAFTTPDPRIKTGMTASISIETGGTPNTLVIPQGAIYERNGQQTVQVLAQNKVIDRVVTLGEQSLGDVAVTAGLMSGDMVVLNPDTTK